MNYAVVVDKVKGKSKEFYQAVLKGDDQIIMRLEPGESFSVIGVSVGETEQIWISSVRSSVSTIRYLGTSVELVCQMAMYVTDIWPVRGGRLLVAGSTGDRYLVELVDQAAFSARVATFERPIGGGNPDTRMSPYPTFGSFMKKFVVGWRLRKKGGVRADSDSLLDEQIIPPHRPIEDFNLTSALARVGVSVEEVLEAADEKLFYRQLYI